MRGPKQRGLPQAVCTFVVHDTGLVLAVSRRDDPLALGLPGGKVDRGESLSTAAARELREETGLGALELTNVFVAPCRGGEDGVDYLTHTFLCRGRGRIATRESGRVVWVARDVLVELGAPFAEYNAALFDAIDGLFPHVLESFFTTIPLDPAHVLGLEKTRRPR